MLDISKLHRNQNTIIELLIIRLFNIDHETPYIIENKCTEMHVKYAVYFISLRRFSFYFVNRLFFP